ncbi:MAG: Asp-tRNA(Asn)/Glu-tRNA(Gln) amidotransferase subunit GatB [Actinomycetota bacterium]|nr:Asp-tRNA(Asn)/Glu-tRNA(Gln) amidotransferase subunit GatB [Actinomycetota bacterium]
MEFETVIGLEIHIELNTSSKMFCGCSTEFGGEPNARACPVCLGHPGVLPVVNRGAVESAIMLALALNCKISERSIFHRKNYFYPDMPKNYQISQYDVPLSVDGWFDIDMGEYERRVGIVRVHLEEDTGKSIHVGESGRIHGAEYSLEDFNRAGIPLAEIVTRPDIRSPEESSVFLQNLRDIAVYLGISDCKMEEGSLRCDANISISVDGKEGTKVEIKNMNSFRSLRRALSFEEERQRGVLNAGREVKQETRHFDEVGGETHSLRSKEEAFDYRYFPEPDLVPLEPDKEWTNDLRAKIPELPQEKRKRYESALLLPKEISSVLVGDRALAEYFERALTEGQDPVELGKWVSGELLALLRQESIPVEECRVEPSGLANLIKLVSEKVISGKMAKDVLREAFDSGERPEEIVKEGGLFQISDENELVGVVDDVIKENPMAVSDFKSGKEQALKFLMGKVMKKTRGKASPEEATRILTERLENQA